MNGEVIVRTLFSRMLFIVIILIFAIPIICFMCVPDRYRYSHAWVFTPVYWFYSAILKCTLVPITYSGLEHIPDEPVIFAANHQSSLDIPLVGVLSKNKPHVWLAKHELMNSFFMRFVVPLLAVLVDASSVSQAMRSLRKIISIALESSCNIMIFPEGGRFVDGNIHDFFGGFTLLAKKIGRPVVPVCIRGVNRVYPPDSFLVYRHPINVIVGKPFVWQQSETDEDFKKRIHAWFVDQRKDNV